MVSKAAVALIVFSQLLCFMIVGGAYMPMAPDSTDEKNTSENEMLTITTIDPFEVTIYPDASDSDPSAGQDVVVVTPYTPAPTEPIIIPVTPSPPEPSSPIILPSPPS